MPNTRIVCRSDPLEQLGELDAERAGDADQRGHRQVRLARLDGLEVLRVEVRLRCRVFLRQPLLSPQDANTFAKCSQGPIDLG